MVKFWGRDKQSGGDQSKLGSRVFVRQDPEFGPGPWPAEPTGTIVGDPDGATCVTVNTRQGPERMWWVRFDEPQRDAEGDGPYKESQVVEFMLGTGARIGETCALRLPQVDLEGGTVEISATATAFGIEERPKTKAGWRVIAVPPNVVQILRCCVDSPELRTDVTIFPSPIGRVRDSSNTTADLRRALTDAGFGWVTSHTFRKTVATRLDEAGLSARQIADHLGHAAPSMTQDVYMGRRVASSDAAKVLDR